MVLEIADIRITPGRHEEFREAITRALATVMILGVGTVLAGPVVGGVAAILILTPLMLPVVVFQVRPVRFVTASPVRWSRSTPTSA